MKKNLFILALLLCITLGASAQKKFNLYAVGFYNQENLFDTCHDEGKRDYDFLPNGSYKWNGLKYTHKLRNMAQAIADLGTDKLPGIGCAIVGMSEVENSKVLDDLTAQAPLKQRRYKYVHVEGPDRRGIDCAMLYNPRFFRVLNVVNTPLLLPDRPTFRTRDQMCVTGLLGGEKVSIIVNHWPSRLGGQEQSSPLREAAAARVKQTVDSLLALDPNQGIIIMGDLNDEMELARDYATEYYNALEAENRAK